MKPLFFAMASVDNVQDFVKLTFRSSYYKKEKSDVQSG